LAAHRSIGDNISQSKWRNSTKIFFLEAFRIGHQQQIKHKSLNHPFNDPLSMVYPN